MLVPRAARFLLRELGPSDYLGERYVTDGDRGLLDVVRNVVGRARSNDRSILIQRWATGGPGADAEQVGQAEVYGTPVT
jgi:hypothetical protein